MREDSILVAIAPIALHVEGLHPYHPHKLEAINLRGGLSVTTD
jgi:hypothetical protein